MSKMRQLMNAVVVYVSFLMARTSRTSQKKNERRVLVVIGCMKNVQKIAYWIAPEKERFFPHC